MPGGLVVSSRGEPHGRTTGNAFACGSGWPMITFTDGSKWNLRLCGRLMSGANIFFHRLAEAGRTG
jgi:hypothetical protein